MPEPMLHNPTPEPMLVYWVSRPHISTHKAVAVFLEHIKEATRVGLFHHKSYNIYGILFNTFRPVFSGDADQPRTVRLYGAGIGTYSPACQQSM